MSCFLGGDLKAHKTARLSPRFNPLESALAGTGASGGGGASNGASREKTEELLEHVRRTLRMGPNMEIRDRDGGRVEDLIFQARRCKKKHLLLFFKADSNFSSVQIPSAGAAPEAPQRRGRGPAPPPSPPTDAGRRRPRQ